MSKRFGRTLNELEYVLAAGPNRVGALAFGPDLEGPKILGPDGYGEYETRELDLALCQKAVNDAVSEADSEELTKLLKYGPSIGGARPKAAVTWNGKPYVAKFSTSLDTRKEPEIEYATMRLAALAGIDIPDVRLEKISGRSVYLIERFDRVLEGEREKMVPYLSGLTMMGLHERDHDRWSYELLCQAIVKLSDRVEEDLEELFRRMVFNILVNNNDDHPRNHAFIHAGRNCWRLSKAFDIVPLDQAYQTFRLALIVGTEAGKAASKSNALSNCDAFGLTRTAAENIWTEVRDVVAGEWERLFLESGLEWDEVQSFRSSIGATFKD